ncbi:MAG: transposase [Campylobacterales bacterium]|nr:transposase [Campylobacterales bacterium]
MARLPRIEIPGYYHIINRGVEQREVFKEKEDYEYFIERLSYFAKQFDITIHNYCLMNNHYHLLIETRRGNLSKFMRQINGIYAVYFNKKYKRSGHLWQGRFKSWYITNEVYLCALTLYIEQNPLKAKIVKDIADYPYSSCHYFLEENTPEFLKDSWIATNYKDDKDAIKAFLNSIVDTSQLQELKTASSLIEAPNIDKKPNEENLRKILLKAKDIKERNKLIVECYAQGYSQHMMAKILKLNQATVHRVIERNKKR